MPRYIFDAHDDQPAHWGDDSLVCNGQDEIERQARHLIDKIQASQAARGSVDSLTTVFVFEEEGGIVLTAYAQPGQEISLHWTEA